MRTLLIMFLSLIGFVPSSLSDASPSLLSALSVSTPAPQKSEYTKQKEIEVINSELESLMNLREYYSSKMTRYRNRAMRYEFQGDNLEESKHLSNQADKIEDVVRQIDEEITKLEKQRDTIMGS